LRAAAGPAGHGRRVVRLLRSVSWVTQHLVSAACASRLTGGGARARRAQPEPAGPHVRQQVHPHHRQRERAPAAQLAQLLHGPAGARPAALGRPSGVRTAPRADAGASTWGSCALVRIQNSACRRQPRRAHAAARTCVFVDWAAQQDQVRTPPGGADLLSASFRSPARGARTHWQSRAALCALEQHPRGAPER